MDNLGKNLLPCTALPGDQHREIGWSNLQTDINGPVQPRVVPNDFEPLLNALNIHIETCEKNTDKITLFYPLRQGRKIF
jgi:hypothetical protein